MKTVTLMLLALSLLTDPLSAQNSLQIVWTGYGEVVGNYYGYGASVGDSNNDVVISKWMVYPNSGGGYVYLGGADMDTIPDVLLHHYYWLSWQDRSPPPTLMMTVSGTPSGEDHKGPPHIWGRLSFTAPQIGGRANSECGKASP